MLVTPLQLDIWSQTSDPSYADNLVEQQTDVVGRRKRLDLDNGNWLVRRVTARLGMPRTLPMAVPLVDPPDNTPSRLGKGRICGGLASPRQAR